MIFYFNASGDSIGMSPERVYQGSVKANKIYCVCPTSHANIASVTYDLPNGAKSATFILNKVLLENSKEMVDKNGITFNMWEADLHEIASAFCGSVGVQFTFTSPNGEILNTSYCRFYVERGINIDEPPQTDSYQEIVSYLATVNTELLDASNRDAEMLATISQNTAEIETLQTETTRLQNDLSYTMGAQSQTNLNVSGLTQMINVLSPLVRNNESKIEKLEKEAVFLNAVLKDTVIDEVEVVDTFEERITAGGLSVVNGSKTKVDKIYGKTVEGDDGEFYDAKFYGVKSFSANMFSVDESKVNNEDNYTIKYDSESGVVTVNGSVGANWTLYHSVVDGPLNQTYSVKFEYLSGEAVSSQGEQVSAPIRVYLFNSQFATGLMVSKEDCFATGVVPDNGNKLRISILSNTFKGMVYKDYKFRVMMVKGGYTNNQMLPYRPYKNADESFKLNESMMLGEYDYIDVKGQNYYRYTQYVVKETPFTEEEIASYDKAVVSSDGKKLYYKTSSYWQGGSIYVNAEYTVEEGGVERLFYPEGEEKPETLPTILQKYYVKAGV